MDLRTASCATALDHLERCINNIANLDNWRSFNQLLLKLNEKYLNFYIRKAIEHNLESSFIVKAFEKLFYCQWIDSILMSSPVLVAFNRISHDIAIKTFAENDTKQFEVNKAKIRMGLSNDRPSLNMIAPGSSLAILLREGEKKRKQKSIRSLISETGDLIQRIKPCFLMSPLSVSTFLATKSVRFDVVIFDEASQVFPQDAVCAIYRAKQLIVVGDSRQMPPSNFFNAISEIDDDEDEEAGDVSDFESILDLCMTSFPHRRLC